MGIRSFMYKHAYRWYFAPINSSILYYSGRQSAESIGLVLKNGYNYDNLDYLVWYGVAATAAAYLTVENIIDGYRVLKMHIKDTNQKSNFSR